MVRWPLPAVVLAAVLSPVLVCLNFSGNGSLPAATYHATAVAYNGYVYQIGGYAGSVTAVVDYAAITSSGALAAPGSCAGTITGYWCASTSTANGSLPAATYFATAVAYNGYVYQIGGYAGSVTAVVDYAAINNGGPATLSAWAATGSLPAATYQATAVAYNGYIYQIGGYTTAATAVVDYAAITSSGALAAPVGRLSLAGYYHRLLVCLNVLRHGPACRLPPTSLPLSPTMAMSIR